MPTDDDWTHGEIARALTRIEQSVTELRGTVGGLSAGFLPRGEWEMWAKSRDREIAELKAGRAPWWTWATVALAALSLLVAIVPRLVA